jgi:hypothetical protein
VEGKEKPHSLHDDGLYYWKFGVSWYHLLFLPRNLPIPCFSFYGRTYCHFRRRRAGNWLENLAKHLARRLVYYFYLLLWKKDRLKGGRHIAKGGYAQGEKGH